MSHIMKIVEKNYFNQLSSYKLGELFMTSCFLGHLEIVKHLLTSPDLNNNVDIHFNNDVGFMHACAQGQLEVVKYLLTSPELKEHVNIHSQNELGLKWACLTEQIEIVKYLLTSPELKEHANIYIDEYYIFKKCHIEEQNKTISFLIFDYNIEKKTTISYWLTDNYYYNTLKLFEKREFEKKLHDTLDPNEIKKRQVKI